MRVRSFLLSLVVTAGLLGFTYAFLSVQGERGASAASIETSEPSAQGVRGESVRVIPEGERLRDVPGRVLVKFRVGVELEAAQGKVGTDDAKVAAILERVGATAAVPEYGWNLNCCALDTMVLWTRVFDFHTSPPSRLSLYSQHNGGQKCENAL